MHALIMQFSTGTIEISRSIALDALSATRSASAHDLGKQDCCGKQRRKNDRKRV